MKVRVTLMTENDKHVDENISDEEIQKQVEWTWNLATSVLSVDNDVCIVEKVEVVER